MSAMTLGAPAVAHASPAPVVAQVESSSVAPAPAARSDAGKYAQRESQDKHVADYQGGNTVVIAMSGGAFVVLLLLLLLL